MKTIETISIINTVRVYEVSPVYCQVTDGLIGSCSTLVASFRGIRGARRYVQGRYNSQSFDHDLMLTVFKDGKMISTERKAAKQEWASPVEPADSDYIPF